MSRVVEGQLRLLLGVVLAAATVGVALELILLEHYEEWQQWLPLAALPVGLFSVLGVLFGRSAFALGIHLVVMIGFVLVGTLGVFLHYRGNAEFELEMVPELGGLDLIIESLTGATPVLAPGTMVLLGLLGLILVYRHPRLRSDGGPEDSIEEKDDS